MEFDKYLLRELFYQLKHWNIAISGLTDVPQTSIKVLAYKGYDYLRLQTVAYIVDAKLDWSMQTAPVIEIF